MSRVYMCIGSVYQHPVYDNLIEKLRKLPTHADYSILTDEQIKLREPSGFAAVMNRLVNCAFSDPDARKVWILNDDIEPMGDALATCEKLLDLHPDVGVVFPVEAWLRENVWETIHPVTGNYLLIEEALSDEFIDRLFAGFACACIRRDVWEKVGPMDESLGKGYCEDFDHGIRTWKAGYRCVNLRSKWFKHVRGRTFDQLIKDGKYTKEAPYEAAEKLKLKWPELKLWAQPHEAVMATLYEWFSEARHGNG